MTPERIEKLKTLLKDPDARLQQNTCIALIAALEASESARVKAEQERDAALAGAAENADWAKNAEHDMSLAIAERDAERERCAKIADHFHERDEIDMGDAATGAAGFAAAAIRNQEPER